MPVISVEHLSKSYRLGQINTGTFSRDLEAWWARLRGRPNPHLRIGETDHGNRDGEELWALRDVSFTVQQGEVLGIIGRNGAGKSTLLKILSRVTAPTSGRIRVKGRVASLLEVGTGFHPELTGRENVYLNGAILGMTRQEVTRKFDEIVDFAGVEKFIDTPVKRYSSGMYVRLAFAVAAHLDPEILVVDEVLAVGDAEFQKKCLGKMGEVAQGGRTVLFVSHNMGAIQSLTKHSLILKDGQISFIGNTYSAIEQYLFLSKNLDDTPLFLRTDRTGIKKNVLKGITIYADGCPTQTVLAGMPVEISINYAYSEEGNLDFFLAFYDIYNQRVAHLNTIMTGLQSIASPSNGIVSCKIPRFSLSPGKYFIAVAVNDKNILLDRIENASEILVEMGDYYGTGQHLGLDWGKFLIDHSWSIMRQ